jgi:hypothetical protein
VCGEGGDGRRGRAAFVGRAALLATRGWGRGVGIGGLGLGTRHWIWLDAMGHLLLSGVLEVVVRRGVEVPVSVGGRGWRRSYWWRGRVSGGRAAICAVVLFPGVMMESQNQREPAFKQTGTNHPNMAQDYDGSDQQQKSEKSCLSPSHTRIGDRTGSVCADAPSGTPVSHAVPRITRPSASLFTTTSQ